MKKCLIISNPYSGKGIKEDYKEQITRKLLSYGYDPIFISTKYKNHAYEIAKTVEGVDLVIAQGGDGTVHEVTSGNIAREESVLQAIIPTGTTNDVAKMYRIEKNPLDAIEQFMNGEEKEVEFPEVNDNPFVYVAGMGQFLHIPYSVNKESKDKFGYIAYLKGGWDAWCEGTIGYNATMEIDGKKYHIKPSILIVSNSTRIAGFNGVYPKNYVKLNDGKFEVAYTEIEDKSILFKRAFKLAVTDISNIPEIKFFQTDNFKITFEDELLHNPCVDGEEFISNNNEYGFEMSKKVKMLLPKKNINKLF